MDIAANILDFYAGLSGVGAYVAILGVLCLCGFGLPVPEDITLLAAGFLAAMEQIHLPGAFVVGFFGVLIGDTVIFFMGRRYGRNLFRFPGLRRIFTPPRIESAEQRIRKNARFVCFVARFLPGLRAPIFATAGIMKVRPSIFFVQDGSAALISVPVWIYVGYWFGENLDEALATAGRMQTFIVGAVLLLIVGYVILSAVRRKKLVKAQSVLKAEKI